jgi:tetratricopeptide (TPR) repeat protein
LPSAQRRFDRALQLYRSGRLYEAEDDFRTASARALQGQEPNLFIECTTYLIRILAEQERFGEIDQLEREVRHWYDRSRDLNLRVRAKGLYVLGIANVYQETRHEEAMNLFREAVDLAVLAEDRSALADPLYGAATVLYARGRYPDARLELDRLDVLLSVQRRPELESAVLLLRALIARNQKNFSEALEMAWRAFESVRSNPNLILSIQSLILLAQLHALKGEVSAGRAYVELAHRLLDRRSFPRLGRLLDEVVDLLGPQSESDFDLHFDVRTGLLRERLRGEVRFEGQFVLRDLLFLFMKAPGHVFSKEDLARAIWSETYQPERHDNKIYVTIKRLRQLIESSEDSNRQGRVEYIMRDKTGYFLNPRARIKIVGASEGTNES